MKQATGKTTPLETVAGDPDSTPQRRIESFLGWIFDRVGDGFVYSLWTAPSRRKHFFTVAETQKAAGWAMAMSRREAVFLTPALFDQCRQIQTDRQLEPAGLTGLWLKLDIVAEDERAQPSSGETLLVDLACRFPLEPTLILRIGSGVIAAWLFNRPWLIADQVDREAADLFGHRFLCTMRAHAAAIGLGCESANLLADGLPLQVPVWDDRAGNPRPSRGGPVEIERQNDRRYEAEEFRPHLIEDVITAQDQSAAILGDQVVRIGTGQKCPPASDSEPADSGVQETSGPRVTEGDAVEPVGADLGRMSVEQQDVGRYPLTNYAADAVAGTGDRALRIGEIAQGLLAATGGWPKRFGRHLFVMENDGVRWIDDTDVLFAWLHSRGPVRWQDGVDAKGVNFVSRGELLAHLASVASVCETVSPYPWEPAVSLGPACWTMPAGYESRGEYLDRFLGLFSPATPLDASLLRAMLLTFVWGGLPGQRPLFVLLPMESSAGASGRTQCLRLLAEVVGGAVEISAAEAGMIRSLENRLVSRACLQKRVVIVDEFPGMLLPQTLARWVDSESLNPDCDDDRLPSRPNLVTWCVLARQPCDVQGSRLSERAVVIRLGSPDWDARPMWQSEVRGFIQDHRPKILADAVAALRGGKYSICVRRTRFSAWCQEVLATDQNVNTVLDELHLRAWREG